MNRFVVILAVCSAMCLGLAMGFAGGVMFSHHMAMRGSFGWPMHMGGPRFLHGDGGGRPFMGPPPARVVMPHLRRMLDLSDSQVVQIRIELEHTSDQMATERDSLHDRIARHLTPAQRERFDQMLRERHPGDFRGLHAPPDRDGPGPEREEGR